MKKNNKFLLFLVSVILVSIFCLIFIQSEVDDSSFDVYAVTERFASELQKNKYLEKYYGGRYIDEQGNFVVLITKDAQANVINIFDSALSSDKIIYSPCDYSMVELEAIKEEIEDLWFNKDLDPKFSVLSESLGMTSIRDDLNRIVVNLSNCNEEKIALLKEYVSDFNAVIIGEEFEYHPHAQTLSPGDKITVQDISTFPSTSSSVSIGFRCMESNSSGYSVRGLVTAGHVGVERSPVFDSLGDKIGEVRRTSFGDSDETLSDSAFVYISQPSYLSNNIAYGTRILASSPYITQFSLGSRVYKVGFATEETNGVINSLNASVRLPNTNYVVRDCVTASYASAAGDSGGLVFSIASSGNLIAGIHMGTVSGGYAIFSKSYNVFTSLGVAPY